MQSWRPLVYTYLSASWRYRWQGLAAAWVVCVLGWIGVALTPNSYESGAQVYIDTHTLLRPLLNGLAVTTDPNQEISVLLQTLLTDPTLQRIYRATHPGGERVSSLRMQDEVAKLRKNVSLKNLQTRDLYSIGYTDRDPAYAQAVAQTLVSVLIDSSLGSQRRDADQVGTFLDNQITNYQQKIQAAERRRGDFKQAHLDFFARTPGGDRVSGLGDVLAAQEAVTQTQSALNEAIDRRNSLHEQVQATPQKLSMNAPLPATMDRSGTAISPQAQLAAATSKLNMLRMQYTDNHPDVVMQKRLIARLKSERSDDAASGQDVSNPAYVMLASKLADADSEVAAHRNRLEEAKKRLETAKNMAAKAISVQREYEDLDRDYQVLHKNYEELVSRRESAKITQAAGDQQSSVVFRVISPPAKPERPIAPNRPLLNAAVLFVGIGAGVALAFALGQLSETFLTMTQVKEAFELPILGAVTTVRTGREKAAAVRSAVFFAAGLSMLILSCGVVVFLMQSEWAGIKGLFL